jgi:hypothetical protein
MDGDKEEKEVPKNAVMIESTLEEHIPTDKNEIIET